LKGDSPSADFCLVTDKIMPDNPYIHPMWTGSENFKSCADQLCGYLHSFFYSQHRTELVLKMRRQIFRQIV
jgi:hypothetical protein